jgi:hypothetical protein
VSNLTKEQIEYLAAYYSMSEEEVIEYEKMLINSTAHHFNVIKTEIIKIWNNIKPFIFKVINLYKNYQRKLNKAFFKKKRTQKKKWRKWKRRK